MWLSISLLALTFFSLCIWSNMIFSWTAMISSTVKSFLCQRSLRIVRMARFRFINETLITVFLLSDAKFSVSVSWASLYSTAVILWEKLHLTISLARRFTWFYTLPAISDMHKTDFSINSVQFGRSHGDTSYPTLCLLMKTDVKWQILWNIIFCVMQKKESQMFGTM